jgi:superfamily II DNA or RNA helicase
MAGWKCICDIFNVNPLAIVNYESIKNGKCYDQDGNRIECKYIEISTIDNKNIEFKWKLPNYSIIIFDETHRCKNHKTQNGQLLLSAKDQRKVLMLSATISDKPESFHIFGYMLNFYKNISQAKNWINGVIMEDKMNLNNKIELSAINKKIYPDKGSRMRIKELGDKFTANQISSDTYFIEEDKRKIINKAFDEINKNTLILKSRKDIDCLQKINETIINDNAKNITNNGEILKEIIIARQLLEDAKIPILVDLTNDYLENGYNVALFVNYNNTVDKLMKLLNTRCVIRGSQTIEERHKNVELFQSNESNIIICNTGVTDGISLHDLHGIPRVSLISPTFSAIQLVQVLGRISRIGAKTPALQRIIYAANTCEEVICNKLKTKLDFLSKLNDNDLINIDE